MIIQYRNTQADGDDVLYTRLRAAEAAGTTSLRLENTGGMTTSWAYQIGQTGNEQTEILIGTVASGTTLSTPTTKYDHPIDTPVYAYKYDQVVFERSTTGTSGTAVPMSSGTVTITPDSFFTQFDDTSGSSTYGYRVYLRNSALSVNSTESDWLTSAGFSFYSLARMRERVKRKLWSSKGLDDNVVDDWINECKDKMANAVNRVNQSYAVGTVNVGFGTNGLGTVTDPNFNGQLYRMDVNFGNTSGLQLSQRINRNTYDLAGGAYGQPVHLWVDSTVFQVLPMGNTGTAQISYGVFGTTLVNDTDELPVPMRSYTHIFTDFARGQALYRDDQVAEAQNELTKVEMYIDQFSRDLAPRDKTSNEPVTLVEPLSGDSGDIW